MFSSLCKSWTGRKLTSFQNKIWPIANYVQTQTSVIFSNISMIIYVLWIYDYTIFCVIFFIHLKPRVESFWGVLSCCLTPSILFNFRYKKIKTYMANFIYICWRGPTTVVHRNENVLKSIFKRGYEEIRDRKLLGILKKDRTWLKYELHCNIKTQAPLFFKNNLTFVIQILINVFPRIVFVFFCT